jgi:hypothetical protein
MVRRNPYLTENLRDAVERRRAHRRDPSTDLCVQCGDRHPCADWRLARANVLVMVRAGFAAARNGQPW